MSIIIRTNNIKRILCTLLLVVSVAFSALAQDKVEIEDKYKVDGTIVNGLIVDGDTVPIIYLEPVKIKGRMPIHLRRQRAKYSKLVRDVKKAYPYAKIAADLLVKYNKQLEDIESESEKKKFLKELEVKMKEEFMSDLKNLTVTQGRILLKLVDRETGNTSYVLLQELRSSFSAVFWQTLAKLFGNDLKATYDPYGTDAQIEEIVKTIEEEERGK